MPSPSSALLTDDARICAGKIGWPAATADGWLHIGPPLARDQGWKLHVSATVASAATVLQQIVPILLTANVSFKVAANPGCLGELNEGLAGFSQVGKFVTIYPRDDEQAVRLAVELDRATAHLPGPRIPSDRPVRPHSLVHYRFGGFKDLILTDTLGQTFPALREPSGRLTPDARSTRFEPPAWVQDPFEAAGIVECPALPSNSLFGGYVIIAVLHQHAKGGVFLALDPRSTPLKTVVIKEARRHLLIDASGRDIRQRLRHQYHLLQALAPDPSLPRVIELFECEDNLYLVMEHIEGTTLDRIVAERQREGRAVSTEQLINLSRMIAVTIGRLHDRGYVFRDLTPSNIIVTSDDRIVLIDLELTHAVDDMSPPFGWGTRGYVSPEQATGEPPARAHDVYSLGATLYFAATGCTPALLSESCEAGRAIRLLNPTIPAKLRKTIAACMDPDISRRPSDMWMVANRFAQVNDHQSPPSPAPNKEQLGRKRRAFLDRARGAGDLLLATAEHTPSGLCWSSRTPSREEVVMPTHLPRRGSYARYLHTGIAGIGLFLADLAAVSNDSSYRDAAEETARWLLHAPNSPPDELPGLYFGEAGVAAFLIRMAQVTGRVNYLDSAERILDRLLPNCTVIPDITHGWAGIGLARLALAATSGESRHLVSARAFGDALAASVERTDGGIAWRQPSGPHHGLSGEILTGFAHGVAGIAYFLLELAHATGDAPYCHLARDAASWLICKAEPCLEDAAGLNWPIGSGGSERWFHWCHGPAGIGLFFMQAWRLTGDATFRTFASAAARTVADAGRWGGTTLCHGLAGNGDFLLEASRILTDPCWFNAAVTIADILDLYARPRERGFAWPGDHPDVVTPDYMVGYSGVGAFFLRMAEPESVGSPLLLPLSWTMPQQSGHGRDLPAVP